MGEMRTKNKAKKTNKGIRVFVLLLVSLIFIGIAASVAVVGWGYVENRGFRETFYTVSSLKVNNKIRVVQIADLHSCTFGNGNAKIIERVGKLQPDIIVYTGDILDSQVATNDAVVSFCEALAKIAPSYYVYGNNEVERYYDTTMTQDALDAKFGFDDTNRDPQKLLELTDDLTVKLEQVGVHVLKNRTETVTVGTTNVDVFGVLTSNPSAFWSYAGASFDEYLFTNTNNFKITAIHDHATHLHGMTIHVFGGGMDHDVCAKADGLAKHGGSKGIIHD